jgi:NADH-quinone oxidoreductase subunit A
MPETVGYILMFTAVGIAFILVNLSVGKLLRPANMNAEKGTIYECGEPTVGSAWVQFDLRFYVVALLFVVFDVEMAFFFPWAVVFGKANQLADPNLSAERRSILAEEISVAGVDKTNRERYLRQIRFADSPEEKAKAEEAWEQTRLRLQERLKENRSPEDIAQQQARLDEHMKNRVNAAESANTKAESIRRAGQLAWIAFFDILFFFGVILVGFAYLWQRGDLNWVRSLAAQKEG